MIYEYQALNKKGVTESDIIDAPNAAKARERLKSQGLYVVKIQPKTSAAASSFAAKKGTGTHISALDKLSEFIALKLSAKEIGIFSRQLSVLLNAGMPLLRAITDIIEQTDNKTFKHIIADVKERLEGGSSFSQALSFHNNIFSEMYINMVRVGENLGSLDSVVERLADIEEKGSLLKSKIQSTLWYPAFMLTFSVATVTFLMAKVVPSLTSIFVETGKELPLPTKIVMGLSSFIANFWIVLFLLSVVGVVLLYRFIKTPDGKKQYDAFLLTVPLANRLYRKLIVFKFTQNLGVLLDNKVDLIKSMEIVKKIIDNSVIETKIDEAILKIKEGMPISRALSASDFLPRMVIGMISAGEQSDSLDKMLVKIGNVYEKEVDMAITSLTSMIEPLIIIIMGVIIGTIVISIILPVVEMNMITQ
jgi:general secretion pathway protein F